ncbi:MAG: lysostaphin resistance A-like protein [Fimbriiglobus sp.]
MPDELPDDNNTLEPRRARPVPARPIRDPISPTDPPVVRPRAVENDDESPYGMIPNEDEIEVEPPAPRFRTRRSPSRRRRPARHDYYDDDYRDYQDPLLPPRPSYGPILLLMLTYAGIMGVSFSQLVSGLLIDQGRYADAGIKKQLIYDNLVLEVVDALIVIVGVVCAGAPLAREAAWKVIPTWIWAIPAFFFAICMNLAYHALLVFIFTDPDAPVVNSDDDIGLKDGFWAILLVCIQPALIEELFFRYGLLGHLRNHLGLHGSVWLSSVLFGMAHLGNVPGWPILILLGAGMGYARVLTGGMALPIILHFCHNFCVLVVSHFGG